VCNFGYNGEFIFQKSVGIKPHFLGVVHVLQQNQFILIRDVLPSGVVLVFLSLHAGKVALLFMQTEVHADALLQFTLFGKGHNSVDALFHVENSHLETRLGGLMFLLLGSLPFFFTFGLI
jgi:hypothetical protein